MRTIRERAESPEYKAGREAYEAQLAEWQRQEQARAAADWREYLTRIGVQREHWAHLSNPTQSYALRVVRSFMNPRSVKALLVLSGVGDVGKSFVGAWAAAYYRGRVVQAQDLVRANNFDEEYWASLESERVLVIDELGMETRDTKGWFDAKFYGLIDGRLRQKTILTTNLAGEAFTARYLAGDLVRLHRRFKAHGRFVPVRGRGLPQPSSAVRRKGRK